MKNSILISAIVCLPVSWSMAGGTGTGENYRVPDVVQQFLLLKEYGDVLGARPSVGDTGFPGCKHYQGMARTNGTGQQYIILSRSGKDTAGCTSDDEPSELLFLRMNSRGQDGERLRSNRLRRGEDTQDSPPPSPDRGVLSIHLDGESMDSNGTIWPYFTHPGGMQLVDNKLFVPVYDNDPESSGDDVSRIWMIDVTDPEDPLLVYSTNNLSEKYGWVAAVKHPVSGQYYVAAGKIWPHNDGFDLYVSNSTDLSDTNFALNGPVYVWHRDSLPDESDWPDQDCPDPVGPACGWDFQAANFLVEPSGTIYLIGLGNTDGVPFNGEDEMRLFQVNINTLSNHATTLTHYGTRQVENSWSGAGTNADWGAAGGAYASPSGNLLLYGSEYTPEEVSGVDTIKMIEYRNVFLNIQQSRPAGPWIEFYRDDDFSSRSIILEDLDFAREDWENLDHHDGWGDEADSLIFNAPVGYKIILYADQGFQGQQLVLTGDGSVQTIPDLDDFEFGDKMHSVDTGTYLVPEVLPTLSIGLQFIALRPFPDNQKTLSLHGGSYMDTGIFEGPVILRSHNGSAILGQ